MDLHGQIMNLPGAGGLSEIGTTQGEQLAYKRGHRDARHAAAELALTADAEIERLRGALSEISKADMTTKGFQMMAIEALQGSPVAFGAA